MSTTRSSAPLVWIDCEMTGLDPSTDTILSVACIITASDLTPIAREPFTAVIHHPDSVLDSMDEWCRTHHGRSGLTAAVRESKTTAKEAADALMAYVKSGLSSFSSSFSCSSSSSSTFHSSSSPSSSSSTPPFPPKTAVLAGNSVHCDRAFLARREWADSGLLDYLHYRILDVSAIKEAARRWASEDVLARAPVKANRHEAMSDVLESVEEARFYMNEVFKRA